MGEHREQEARQDFTLLMYNFSLYLIAADRSTLSLICTVAGGVAAITIIMYVLMFVSALSNGVVSAVLAFSRSFLFTVASIQIMPVLLGGVTGVWLATPAAELSGTAVAAALLLKYRKRYGY